jgi:hypothetical protein
MLQYFRLRITRRSQAVRLLEALYPRATILAFSHPDFPGGLAFLALKTAHIRAPRAKRAPPSLTH